MVLCSGVVLFGEVTAYLRYSSFKVKVFSPVGEGGVVFSLLWNRGEGAVEVWQDAVKGSKVCSVVCSEELKWKTKPKTDWWLWIDLAAVLGQIAVAWREMSVLRGISVDSQAVGLKRLMVLGLYLWKEQSTNDLEPLAFASFRRWF